MMGEKGNEGDVLLAMQEVFDYIDQEVTLLNYHLFWRDVISYI